MTGKIVVLSSELIRFEIDAEYWTIEPVRVTAGEVVQHKVRLHITGLSGPVAEFTDVIAVWHLAKGDIIQPPDHVISGDE